MPTTMQTLGIDQLPREVRLQLVQDIWDSIAAEGSVLPLSEAQRCEVERGAAEDDANPNDVVPWDQVKANALARLRQ